MRLCLLLLPSFSEIPLSRDQPQQFLSRCCSWGAQVAFDPASLLMSCWARLCRAWGG